MFKRDLVSAKQMPLSSIRLQPGSFQKPGAYSRPLGNTRERRITVTFGAANSPTLIPHGLSFVPSGYSVVLMGTAGRVYNDMPLPSTSKYIVLKCDTANVVCDILVR